MVPLYRPSDPTVQPAWSHREAYLVPQYNPPGPIWQPTWSHSTTRWSHRAAHLVQQYNPPGPTGQPTWSHHITAHIVPPQYAHLVPPQYAQLVPQCSPHGPIVISMTEITPTIIVDIFRVISGCKLESNLFCEYIYIYKPSTDRHSWTWSKEIEFRGHCRQNIKSESYIYRGGIRTCHRQIKIFMSLTVSSNYYFSTLCL